jgi:hypothetical protein
MMEGESAFWRVNIIERSLHDIHIFPVVDSDLSFSYQADYEPYAGRLK